MPSHTFKDLTNQPFGRLVARSRAENSQRGKARWNCECSCGNWCVVSGDNLRNSHTQSCGCWADEASRTHGRSGSRLYRVWQAMISRCESPKASGYQNYGGKGIRVCERWRASFVAFMEDMGQPPAPGLTIERKNGKGNYEPNNCRWATRKEQARNISFNRLLTFQGQTKVAAEWAELMGLTRNQLYGRLRRGWSVERVLTTPRLTCRR